MKQNFKKGFTLIELLVVIAIIGILAAITVVSVQGPRNKANDTRALADMRQVSSAIEQYAGDSATQAYPASTLPTSPTTAVTAYNTIADLLNPTYGQMPSNGYSAITTDSAYCLWKVATQDTANAIYCKTGAQCGTDTKANVITACTPAGLTATILP